jgi:foldase protein PrsA
MTARVLVSSAIACALAGGLATCGSREAIVARVGDRAVTNATLAHWMAVMAPQHLVPDSPRYAACIARRRAFARQAATDELEHECGQEYEVLRQQALGFLISSRWLIDESAEEGMGVSRREVEQRLAEKESTFANGKPEFEESLKAIAHTAADVELELESELASEKIRRRLVSKEHRVAPTEIAAYYRQNIAHFHIPERRDFYIAENFPSEAFARRVMTEVQAGRSLANTSLSESRLRKPFTDYKGEKRTIYEAIFKAKQGVLTGPIRLNNLYFLIEVTRITPAYVESLAQVRRSIGKKLTAERRRQALATFVAAWRRKWIARTDCAVGYVVQKCRQYSGPMTLEDPLGLN